MRDPAMRITVPLFSARSNSRCVCLRPSALGYQWASSGLDLRFGILFDFRGISSRPSRQYILAYRLSSLEWTFVAMPQTKIVKLFKNGSSQAVRLPAEFRFDGDEVYATRDEVTGDVVLSDRPGGKVWQDFFEMMRSIDVPKEFMADRPMNVSPKERNLFDEES